MSSRLVDGLSGGGLTRTAARQQVSRAEGEVKRLGGVRFPNRERFLFLEDQFGKKVFRNNLVDALINTGSSYGKALLGLKARCGAVMGSDFPVASGLPIALAKRQVQHAFVESKLFDLGLIVKSETPDGTVISLWNEGGIDDRRRAALLVEDIVLGAVKSWLMRVGWTSSKAPTTRSAGSPQFGQFRWDLVAPSYLHGLKTYKNGNIVPGFIVADIILDTEISLVDLEPYFSKCDVLSYQRRSTRFQPMFIADSFTSEALNEVRKRGHFVARPDTLFGADVAETLRQLVSTVEHAAAAVTNNPKGVFDLFAKIARIEGAALNLRAVVLV